MSETVGTDPSAVVGMPRITLRPITDGDMEFLFRLYASTREQERALFGWNDEQWEQFLAIQFRLQHTQYRHNYQNPSFSIVLADDAPAGRFYVDRGLNEYRLIDISLLPEFRSQGIGGSLIRAFLLESESRNAPVTLHVEKFNPALALYQRLGFSVVEDLGAFWLMVRPPAGKTSSPFKPRTAAYPA